MKSPGIASGLGRVALAAAALLVLVGLPENITSWDDPNASVAPSERTMPGWGNYVLAVVLIAAVVLLVAGWILRRRTHTRVARGWAIAQWATVVGLVAWAVALLVSQVISMQPGDAVGQIALTPFIVLDAMLAVVSLATAAVIARDARALGQATEQGDESNNPAPASAGLNDLTPA